MVIAVQYLSKVKQFTPAHEKKNGEKIQHSPFCVRVRSHMLSKWKVDHVRCAAPNYFGIYVICMRHANKCMGFINLQRNSLVFACSRYEHMTCIQSQIWTVLTFYISFTVIFIPILIYNHEDGDCRAR